MVESSPVSKEGVVSLCGRWTHHLRQAHMYVWRMFGAFLEAGFSIKSWTDWTGLTSTTQGLGLGAGWSSVRPSMTTTTN